eukprot:469280_1
MINIIITFSLYNKCIGLDSICDSHSFCIDQCLYHHHCIHDFNFHLSLTTPWHKETTLLFTISSFDTAVLRALCRFFKRHTNRLTITKHTPISINTTKKRTGLAPGDDVVGIYEGLLVSNKVGGAGRLLICASYHSTYHACSERNMCL